MPTFYITIHSNISGVKSLKASLASTQTHMKDWKQYDKNTKCGTYTTIRSTNADGQPESV